MKVLFIVTASDHMTLKDGSYFAGGVFASEFAEPYRIFTEAGVEVDIATPGANVPPFDPISLTPMASFNKLDTIIGYFTSLMKNEKFRHPMDVNIITRNQLGEYSIIYFPGGYGPMEDIAHLPHVGDIVTWAMDMGLLVTATCHGVVGLLNARKENGEWYFTDFKVTGFSRGEEAIIGLENHLKFLIEEKIKEMGAQYSSAMVPFTSHVVEDRNLITGQNPASAPGVARLALERLKVGHMGG